MNWLGPTEFRLTGVGQNFGRDAGKWTTRHKRETVWAFDGWYFSRMLGGFRVVSYAIEWGDVVDSRVHTRIRTREFLKSRNPEIANSCSNSKRRIQLWLLARGGVCGSWRVGRCGCRGDGFAGRSLGR